VAAIRAEYLDTREAANAQLKLSQLKYTVDIWTYLTEFQALNNYTRATGEGLQEKIDLAMPESVLDMRFAHYLGEFADDEGFLQATYQAALQVEKKKALRVVREAMRVPLTGTKDPKKEKEKERRNPSTAKQGTEQGKNPAATGRKAWVSLETALKGVPIKEQDEYKTTENCRRCGRPGHKTFECYAFTTARGTSLPVAPWKASSATGKRKATEEPDQRTVKQRKVAAVEPMEIEGVEPPRMIEAAPWDNSDWDLDF